jgi:hypothetical protein
MYFIDISSHWRRDPNHVAGVGQRDSAGCGAVVATRRLAAAAIAFYLP